MGANSRSQVEKCIKDGFIIKRPANSVSRFRWRQTLEAKRKGRHTGFGKRKGTAEARMPSKELWVRRIRVLRRMLSKFREQKKLAKQQTKRREKDRQERGSTVNKKKAAKKNLRPFLRLMLVPLRFPFE